MGGGGGGGDNELSLEDLDIELEEEVSYGDVAWNFPVDLSDMDPDMIRLANSMCFCQGFRAVAADDHEVPQKRRRE